MAVPAETTRRGQPFNPSLDDLLAEYEISFLTEFSTNPNSSHSHLKLIRQRMSKLLDEADVELLSNLKLYIPVHLLFSTKGFDHRYLVSNLRNNRLELETYYSLGSLCKGIFTDGYRLIRCSALSELIVGYFVLILGFFLWVYATFTISWLYVLISPLVAIALIFAQILIHGHVADFLEEHVKRDEDFARQALSKHWVTVASTDK